MKQHLLPFWLLAVVFSNLDAQEIAQFGCSTDEQHQFFFQNDDNYRAIHEKLDLETAHFADSIARASGGQRAFLTNYTLPIVVHIVSPPGVGVGQGNNLTDAQVEAGLALLNHCFANTGLFQTANGTDIGIAFCLARRDPDGQPTTGITRTESNLVADPVICPPFGTKATNIAQVKQLVNWDCKQYINIWLVTDLFDSNYGCSLAGFAFYPGAPCAIDGIVQESAFWHTFSGTRITAHEMGHYLNLNHTFLGGCNNGDCLLNGDRVCDTPPDDSPIFAPCNTNSCDSDSPDLPDDNTNLMDYTSCSPVHFTDGQRVRMVAGVEIGRPSLITSPACEPAILWDAGIFVETDTACASKICPLVTLKNYGLNPLTAIDFTFDADGGPAQNFSWIGMLAPNQSVVLSLPCITIPSGNHVLNVQTSIQNGNLDGFLSNNSASLAVVVVALKADFTSFVSASTATFTNTSTGATSYFWEFGDGDTSSEANPSHTYPGLAAYSVQLTATNNCGTSSVSQIVFISGGCAGPVASFPFSGNADDVSGNGNHASLLGVNNGPTLTADRFGNPNSAYAFTGFNAPQWMQVLNSPSLEFGKQMTISLWFKQCTFAGMNEFGQFVPHGTHILFSKAGDGIATNPGFFSGTKTDPAGLMTVSFDNVHNADMALDTTITCFDSCEWVHYALVVDYNKVKIYFNGKLQKERYTNKVSFTFANGQDFFLGRMFGGGTIWYPFNGIIDDVDIYKCALSDADVFKLFDNYIDPLADDHAVDIDSISTIIDPCSSGKSHSIIVSANPVGGPYEYSIDGQNWQKSPIFDSLPPKLYKVRVRNECGYGDSLVQISVIQQLADSLIFQESANCKTLGRLFFSAKNGTPPYQFQLDNGPWQPTGFFENIPAGPHLLVIRDSIGCELQRPIDLPNLNTVLEIKVDSSRLRVDCFGGNFLALDVIGGYPFYHFSLDGGLSQPNGFFKNLTVGPHTVAVLDENGCAGGPFNFEILPPLKPAAETIERAICQGDSLSIGQHVYSQTGIYLDTLRVAVGCDSLLLTTNLTVYENSQHEQDLSICDGETVKVGAKIYTKAGVYADTLTNSVGCDSLVGTRISVFEKPVFMQNFTLCPGDSLWLDGKIFTAPGIFNEIFQTISGCDSTILTLIKSGNGEFCDSLHCRMFVPTAFSPNGDGLNDLFEVFSPVVTVSEMLIFDRLGELVHRADGPDPVWDGLFRGEKAAPGTYVWLLKGVCSNGAALVQAGDVGLIR